MENLVATHLKVIKERVKSKGSKTDAITSHFELQQLINELTHLVGDFFIVLS